MQIIFWQIVSFHYGIWFSLRILPNFKLFDRIRKFITFTDSYSTKRTWSIFTLKREYGGWGLDVLMEICKVVLSE